MIVEAYLIVGRKDKRAMPRVRRVTQSRPRVEADEAVVKLQLDLPDDLFEAPLLTIPIAKRSVAVGVEVDEPI
jgi:hypothetical protein